MSLEAIINQFVELKDSIQKNTTEAKGRQEFCSELEIVIGELKKLRGAYRAENIELIINQLAAMEVKIPGAGLTEEQQTKFKQLKTILIENKSKIGHLSFDTLSKFRLPRSKAEFSDRIGALSQDHLYRETLRLFPGSLYLPAAQHFAPELTDSDGHCHGFAQEGLRGILEENRLFGHVLGDKPIFLPIIGSKKMSPRLTLLLNNTVYFNQAIEKAQMSGKSERIGIGLVSRVHHAEKLSIESLLENIFKILSAPRSGFIFELDTTSLDDEGHTIGFARDTNNRLVALDANSGCYVFTSDSIFSRWLSWYMNKCGYLQEYQVGIYVKLEEIGRLDKHSYEMQYLNLQDEIDKLKAEEKSLSEQRAQKIIEIQKLEASNKEKESQYSQMTTEQKLDFYTAVLTLSRLKNEDLDFTRKITEVLEKYAIMARQKLDLLEKIIGQRKAFIKEKLGIITSLGCCSRTPSKVKTNVGYFFKCALPALFKHIPIRRNLSEGPLLRTDLAESLRTIQTKASLRRLNLELATSKLCKVAGLSDMHDKQNDRFSNKKKKYTPKTLLFVVRKKTRPVPDSTVQDKRTLAQKLSLI